MELPSSPAAAEPSTLSEGNQQSTSFDEPRKQLSHLSIKTEQPDTVDGTMEDKWPPIIYHIEADRGCEAENFHLSRLDNTIDFSAGIQDSDVHCVPSDSESDDEMQDSDDGHKTLMQGRGNDASDNHDDNETANDSLERVNTAEGDGETSVNAQKFSIDLMMRAGRDKDHEDVYDEERSIFVDFDEDIDVDDDEAILEHEQDNEMEKDVGIGFGSIKASVYPRTDEIIAQHLSTPGPQSFTDLHYLVSSKNAPGRGLYKVEKVLEHEEGRVAELEEHMRYIQAELREVEERKDMTKDIVASARADFSLACSAAGIDGRLWDEYEAFCESLEPKFGSRGGWSVTCFDNHNGSYVLHDSDLDLFVESAEMPLRSGNFRCEATTVKYGGKTEYVVDFWPLHSLEPRTETATNWEEQYVSTSGAVFTGNARNTAKKKKLRQTQPYLYQLANLAASNTSHDNTIARSLLRSLPTCNLPFSGGWLFEYALEPNRAQHPIESRRWSYRMACRIPVDEQQDQTGVAAKTESAESQDVKMEDAD